MDGKADNNAVNAPSPGGANHGIHRTILAFVRREKRLLLLLSCLSMLLGWQKWGMNKERILSPGTDLARVIPRDDHADGGKSICSLEEVEGVWRIHYDTRPGVSWAFCGIGMILNGDRADRV